jgi:hypothetical protein
MNSLSKIILSTLLAISATSTALAQEQPVMTVSMTEISLLNPLGTRVAYIDLTNAGSGYVVVPNVTISGGGGSGATAKVQINLDGSIRSLTITNSGTGYTSPPDVTFDPPTGINGVIAQGTAYLGDAAFTAPFQNESYGAAQTTIAMTALAVGTFPISGFTYEFFADNISLGTKAGIPPGTPATIGWSPPQPGAYFLTVKASDGPHNATSLPIRYFATGTMLTSPTPNTIVPNGSSVALQATATPRPLSIGGNNAFVRRIDFYADGVLIGTDDTYPYSLIYTPSNPPTSNTPNIKHVVEARAFDNNNNQVSPNGTATLDLFMVPPIGTPPTCVITSPANNAVIPIPPIGTSIPVSVSAGSPTAEGRIIKVELYVDGVLTGTSTTFPYSFSWSPTVVGAYRLLALAYDDKSNVVASTIAPATTTITIAASPTVSVIAPTENADLAIGNATTLTATSNDSNVGGSITRVQFFADGVFVGESTTPNGNQFSVSWTPSSAGTATITAVATNQLGLTTTSAGRAVNVLSAPADEGGSGSSSAIRDIVVEGVIFGGDQAGSFTAVNTAGRSVTFLGSVTVGGTVRNYFFNGIPATDTGAFTGTNAAGQTVTGTFTDTGAFGSLGQGINFSGTVVLQGSGSSVGAGLYTGSVAGRPNSTLTAVVAPNRSVTLIVSDGATRASGKGVVSSTGAFSNIVVPSMGTFSGRVEPSTGFVSGTITGGLGGDFTAAGISDTAPSNGFLRNLSTRGQVGTGNNALTAGFFVGGTQSKQILIRAVGGASLGAFGINGTLANPQLQIFNSNGTVVSSNDNWGGNAAVASAITAVGAFPLDAASTDSALLATLAPGSYTAQVTGVNGTSGIALVELYDTDSVAAFSPRRVINISTRGQVGSGQGQLTAGFMVSGSLPKKVLIRAAGPGLGAVASSLAGSVLADPMLRLVRIQNSGNVVVRENDNWEMGNDASLVREAAAAVGAFAFATGSRDSAILINLPPGTYTAEVSAPGTTTGLALVEVYEIE